MLFDHNRMEFTKPKWCSCLSSQFSGKPETKVKDDKPADAKKSNAEKDTVAGKQKVKIVEPNPDLLKHDEDDDSSDDVEDDSMDEVVHLKLIDLFWLHSPPDSSWFCLIGHCNMFF